MLISQDVEGFFLIIIHARLLPGEVASFHSPSRCCSSKSTGQFTKLPRPAKTHAQNVRRKVRSYPHPAPLSEVDPPY